MGTWCISRYLVLPFSTGCIDSVDNLWCGTLSRKSVCVCVWLSSAFTTGPVGFCLKKSNKQLEEAVFFGMLLAWKWNAYRVSSPKKTLLNRQWTVVKRSASAILKSSYFRFTQRIDGELSERWKRPSFFFIHGIFQGEGDMTWSYVIICC